MLADARTGAEGRLQGDLPLAPNGAAGGRRARRSQCTGRPCDQAALRRHQISAPLRTATGHAKPRNGCGRGLETGQSPNCLSQNGY